MESLEHTKRRRKSRGRRGRKGAGLRKARCVQRCRAGKMRGVRKHTLGNCRRKCHVKKAR